MSAKKPVWRMFYREVKRPDNFGEARVLHSEKAAQATCAWHNKMFRRFHHWAEVSYE